MPAITSLGIGSGADLNTLVTQLVAMERQPLQQMRKAANTLQSQVSSYGQLSSHISNLQTAANKLNNASLWSQATARSSDDSAVGVTGSSGAATGNYSVSASQLASSQTLASAYALPTSDALVGGGRLSLQIGKYDQPPMNFVPQVGRAPVEIDVTDDDTLSTLRDKINSLGAGVTASLVTDSNGVRLALRSSDSGEENAFRLQASDNDGDDIDGNGLSRFAYDPDNGTSSMLLKQPAQNAIALVNGISVSSASNELSGVVDGVTFQLRKANAGTAEISLSSDRSGVKDAIKAFTDSYNVLAKSIGDQTRFDPTSKQGGPLQGDSAVGSLSRQLRGLLVSGSGASSTFSRMSEIGLEMQRDGTLNINSSKLDAAMNNLPELKKAFSNSDSANPANDGFARRYASMATQVLGTDGTLTTRTESLQKLISRNSEAQARLNERVERFQQRMVRQYTALDGNLARLNSLSTSVTQSLAQLSRSNSNN